MTPFTRTVRALSADGSRAVVAGIAAAAALLLAWGAWFLFGQVALYELSTQARIERAPGALSVDAPRGGRVLEVTVTLGQSVKKGDVLVVLDANRETLALGEAEARKQALHEMLTPLKKELRATERLV